MAVLFDQGNKLSKEVWVGHEWKVGNTNYDQEAVNLFPKKKKTRSWPLDWKSCFGQGMKWDASSSMDFGRGL